MVVEVGSDNPVPIYQLHVRFLTTKTTATMTTGGRSKLRAPSGGGWWWLYTFKRVLC
ncbi:hypothetical protein Hanom_Chr12g01155081 [Helianthus anomalus]